LAIGAPIRFAREMGLAELSRRVLSPLLGRRQHRRVRGTLAVDWHVFGARVGHRCETEDISTTGVMVNAIRPARMGSPIVMAIATREGPLEVHGYVAWTSTARMGVRFTRPIPALATQ
jgi:PilZ domain